MKQTDCTGEVRKWSNVSIVAFKNLVFVVHGIDTDLWGLFFLSSWRPRLNCHSILAEAGTTPNLRFTNLSNCQSIALSKQSFGSLVVVDKRFVR